MPKFKVFITQRSYRTGTYELEAPDEDGAFILAEDISFDSKEHPITWEDWYSNITATPRLEDIDIEERKCANGI